MFTHCCFRASTKESRYCPNRVDWDMANIDWPTKSLKLFKSSGEDGIFPALIVDYCCLILPSYLWLTLAMRFIPNSWRAVNIYSHFIFIPKTRKKPSDVP